MPSTQRITDPACESQQQTVTHASLLKNANLWWGEGSSLSPQGVIYSTIDGQDGGLPIAAVDNASRVIKYVVTLGQRYQSYSLVDTRVQDINVVADLNRHDPNAPNPDDPVLLDGTTDGQVDATSPGTILSVDSIITDLLSAIVSYWQLVNFWPKLFLSIVKQTAEMTYDVLISTDLIGSIEVHRMSVHSLAGDGYTDGEIQTQADLSAANIMRALVEGGKWAIPVGLGYTLGKLRACSWDLPKLTVGVIIWMAAFLCYISFVFWT